MTSAVPHGGITSAGNIHVPYQWTYADAAARTAATGFVASDVGKLARQLDDNSLWMLIDDSPETWIGITGSAYTDEQVRDVIGAALVAGNNIDITVNDGADTITIDVEALTSADIGDFNEAAQDAVGTILADTASINLTYTDATPEIKADAIFGTTSGTVAEGNHTHAGSYTDEQAQDAVGTILTDSSSIDFTYNDGANTITAAVIDEYIADLIGGMLTDGAGIDFTYNDGANQNTAEPIFAGSGSAGTVAHSDHAHVLADVTGGVQPLLTWKSGTYHGTCSIPGYTSGPINKSLTNDRLYAHPMLVPKSTALDQIVVNINSSAAGNVHMGIYTMGSDGLPGALVVDAGVTATATTGDKTATLSLTLAAGWYWIASLFSASPTAKAYDKPTSPSSIVGNTTGPSEISNFYNAVFRAFSYGSLPDPFGAITGYTDQPPRVMVRVA